MKMIDSTTAVKVPVKKGIETAIKSRSYHLYFLQLIKYLITGNYGLRDTAKVKIVQQ